MADSQTEALRAKVAELKATGQVDAHKAARAELVKRDHAFTHVCNAVIGGHVEALRIAGASEELIAAAVAEVARMKAAKAARRAAEAQS